MGGLSENPLPLLKEYVGGTGGVPERARDG